MIKFKLISFSLFFGLLLFNSPTGFLRQSATKGDLIRPQVEIDIDQIKKRGYLVAIVDNNSISYFIYKGRPMGYRYELLNNLAKELKVDLRVEVVSSVDVAIDMLNRGEGDILAFQFEPTEARSKYVSFAANQFLTSHVLVQRKPDNWRNMSSAEIEQTILRKSSDLVGKTVHVTHGSSYKNTIDEVSSTLNYQIKVVEDSIAPDSESLIQKVAFGEIDYTISSECYGEAFSVYYPNIDVQTKLTGSKQVSWAFRKNSPKLAKISDSWMARKKKSGFFNIVYTKYFKSPKSSYNAYNSDFSSISGNRISIYDEVIKAEAKELGWDWLLLASLIYQESTFRSNAESWAGAKGLMQLMPATAKRFGSRDKDIFDPLENIKIGVRCLKHYDLIWKKYIKDNQERINFVLASYNAGIGHVFDARRLARKYGKKINEWSEVVKYLKLKSDPKYYLDPIVVSGYCNCREPINYIKSILNRYRAYSLFFKDT